jgi:hypothetical protein
VCDFFANFFVIIRIFCQIFAIKISYAFPKVSRQNTRFSICPKNIILSDLLIQAPRSKQKIIFAKGIGRESTDRTVWLFRIFCLLAFPNNFLFEFFTRKYFTCIFLQSIRKNSALQTRISLGTPCCSIFALVDQANFLFETRWFFWTTL